MTKVNWSETDKLKAERDHFKILLRRARNEIMDKIRVEVRDCVLYDAINEAIGELAKDVSSESK